MTKHVDMLGLAFIAYGLMGTVLVGFVALLFVGFCGLLAAGAQATGDTEMLVIAAIYGVMGVFVTGIAALYSIPNIVVGAGLRRGHRWAWYGGLACAALAFTSAPLGSLLSVFAFVVLLDRQVNEKFNGGPSDAAEPV